MHVIRTVGKCVAVVKISRILWSEWSMVGSDDHGEEGCDAKCNKDRFEIHAGFGE